MLEMLAREGRADVAVDMLLEDTYPSYGYMIKGGLLGAEPATTMWELWNSDQEGPGMNSRNHIMFGTVSSFLHKGLMGIAPLAPGWATIGLRPTAIGHNLTAASAVETTPFGELSASWSINGKDGTCATAPENSNAHLACSAPGDTIKSVTFASFGTPTGDCTDGGNTFKKGSCDLNTTIAKVSAACVGKQSCDLPTTDDFFGDPCYGTKKTLAVAISCASGKSGSRTYSLAVEVPLGATAHVAVRALAKGAAVAEGGTSVWANDAFVPGVPGITSAKALGGLEPAIEFVVGSGSYEFTSAIDV